MKLKSSCRKVHVGSNYIRLTAFDSTHGWESIRMSFITDRPKNEPGFMVVRQERDGRMMAYTTLAYVADKPEGERYAS
jgi:ribulose-bisphosphate carboxylase small chain